MSGNGDGQEDTKALGGGVAVSVPSAATMTIKGEEVPYLIKSVDMSEVMKQTALEIAAQALTSCELEKEMAYYMKKQFDLKFGPTWHAVVGEKFGSYCSHESGHFIYFYMGYRAFLLFK